MNPTPAALALVICTLIPSGAEAQTAAPDAAIRDIASNAFTMVVKADGVVLGWGRDSDGQAGQAPSAQGTIPVPTALRLPGKVLQVALGANTCYALLEDGTVVSWGTNDEGQLGNGRPGAKGELGVYPKPSATPVPVTGLSEIIQIEAGLKHAVALRRDGTVWAWGTRDNANVGDGAFTGLRPVYAPSPVQVPGLAGITRIAAAGSHNLALKSNGRVVAWGSNRHGELGNGTRDTGWSPTEVAGLDRIVSIAAGVTTTASVSGAVRDDGTVWMWGSNTSAMMGNGAGPMSADDTGGRNLEPLLVKGVTGAKALSIGNGHVGALLNDSSIMMWGHDGWGQIGVGTAGFYHQRPMKVRGITNVTAVFAVGFHSFAVRADGTVWMWGAETPGGQGIYARNLRVPTQVTLP